MRATSVPLGVVLVLTLSACGGGDGTTSGPGSDAASPAGTAGSPAATSDTTSGPRGGLADQFDGRYCEVLTVTVADGGTTAEVWGTQGLNDCPQGPFEAIDPVGVAAELGVTVALPNGPRHWVLDDIVANELAGSGATRSFGGIEMRSIAVVDLGVGVPDRTPYAEVSVARDTEFTFDAGRAVHELTGPDGSVYVMQSYSLEVDPTLDVAALAGLGGRLSLPDGWTFASRTLDEPLVVEDVEGVATVVQDELLNTYQLRLRA
jgi:hypothetical protein